MVVSMQEYEVKASASSPHGCFISDEGVTSVAYSNWKDGCVKREGYIENELIPEVNVEPSEVYKKLCDLWPIIDNAPAGKEIAEEVLDILKLLLDKNVAYGNSALEPIGIFSKSDPVEQINIRIDDKLNRIQNGKEYATEDTEQDLIGYLVLRRVARKFGH